MKIYFDDFSALERTALPPKPASTVTFLRERQAVSSWVNRFIRSQHPFLLQKAP